MASDSPQPTFSVRFVGDDIAPERIPLRAVNDALSAVQDIASARDPFEMGRVPPEKSIGLLDVRRGSAIYSCVARAPDEAKRNLSRFAAVLTDNGETDAESDLLVSVLSSIQSLSEVAKSNRCRIEIDLLDGPQRFTFSVSEGDFTRLSKSLLLKGDTTVVGKIERAGGVTGMKCLLRVPGRRRALYCNVQSRDLVRRLGQHLYETIAATGSAVWIHRSWRIYKFTIHDFSQPQLGDGEQALKELRRAGLDAWDNVADPAALMEEMRGDSGN
jgi:hypothetical protein